jgi:hypothetical protein
MSYLLYLCFLCIGVSNTYCATTKQKQSRETGNMVYIKTKNNKTKTIQRNWQHGVHKTKNNKTKTQHNMCWTHLYTKNTNKVNKTCDDCYDFRIKQCSVRLPPVVCRRAHVLFTLFVFFVYRCVQHITKN